MLTGAAAIGKPDSKKLPREVPTVPLRGTAVPGFNDPEIFRAVFETAATGMALATPDGRFLRVNRALCRIAARSEDELLATALPEITHPDDRSLDERELVRIRSGDTAAQAERRWLRPDGSIVWVEVQASPGGRGGGGAVPTCSGRWRT